MDGLPAEVEVVVETPRGSLVKWASDGRVAFMSPIPSPFNYGAVPGTLAADGAPADALVLGPRLARGHLGRWRVHGVVHFVDAGVVDDKLVCGDHPPTAREVFRLHVFFRAYALAKRVANRLRRRPEPTRFDGWSRA